MLESVSSKCKKLQSYIKELNNAEQKSHQNGSTLVRPEFSQAQVQRIIQDRFILLATYEGKHNDGAFHDLLKSSSCTPEESMDAMNIDLTLCNWAQRETRLCEDVKQQNDRGSHIKIEDYVSCIIKDPDFIIPLAEAVVHSINSQNSQVGLNLNLGLREPHL
uniref:Uncharacterized protein n=1 Tax=Cajanus cajan TaxID=3821 RepID=A0A151QLT9_CAJCA|nr:hypothetical protein KK1_048545 [Cajanus cajan]